MADCVVHYFQPLCTDVPLVLPRVSDIRVRPPPPTSLSLFVVLCFLFLYVFKHMVSAVLFPTTVITLPSWIAFLLVLCFLTKCFLPDIVLLTSIMLEAEPCCIALSSTNHLAPYALASVYRICTRSLRIDQVLNGIGIVLIAVETLAEVYCGAKFYRYNHL